VPVDGSPGESFAGLTLRLRGRTGLTQAALAEQLEVHVHSVQFWEGGTSHPTARRLEALLEVFLARDGFTDGRELEEAEALWTTARNESARLNTPFDAGWFSRLLEARAAERQPVRAVPSAPANPRQQSWGGAPDVERFLSRSDERATLSRWILGDGCRVVGVLGIGGIGKTLLATRVARDLQARFQHVYWRSLQNAPAFDDWLSGAISLLSPRDPLLSASEAGRFDRLLELVREAPSLFIIDNFETVLQPGRQAAAYLWGYAAYGELLQLMAETPHQSCVLLTSREEPRELGPLKGSDGPVRTLTLPGLDTQDIRGLLRDKKLRGDAAAWTSLVERYGGNGLALKLVGETIRELFGGNITEFLADVDPHGGIVGGVRQLLDSQMDRLSELEQRVLRWMAVEREPVTFAELAVEMGAVAARGAVREATVALLRRSLLERREPGPTFLLQPVILEYVTEQFNTHICQQVIDGSGPELRQQALLKATATDTLRHSQERLILQPIVDQLTVRLGGQAAVERRLVELLDQLRTLPSDMQLYGPGNVVNLLRLLRGDLRRIDLSRLLVRQAYLQGVEAQDASLAEAQVVESALPEAFHTMSVALSPDGSHLVTGTSTGDVCLRRAADRTLLLSTRGHAGAVWRVGLSADGRLLVSASEDGTARVWQASSGEPIATLQGHTDFVQGIALSDDNMVATASQDATLKLWHALDGQLLQTFESPDGGVLSVAISRDGALLVGGTRGGSIVFWDVASGQLIHRLRGHSASVPGLALSSDGRMLASASLDGTAKLWDVRKRRLRSELVGHSGGIWNIRLSRSGALAATAGQDGTVRVWSADDGALLTTLVGHNGAVWDVSLSADGTRVASSGQDGDVRLADTRTGALLTTLHGHTSAFRDVALSADGQVLASGSQAGAVTIWDTASGEPTASFHGHTANVSGVALSHDASVAVSGSQDGTIKVWDVTARRLRWTLTGHTGTVWDVALSGDGQLVASSSYDGTVKLWDTRQGTLLATLRGHTQGVRGVALNDARGLIVSGSQDGTLMLWDTHDGQLRSTLRGHANSVQSVAIDGGGLLVASAGFDGAVKLWDTAEGVCLRTLPAHSGGVLCVRLSQDGRLLVTGGFDRAVKVWDAQTGRLLNTFTGHGGPVWGVALDVSAALLASGSFDGTIKLWDIPSGVCQRTLQLDRPFERVNISGMTGLTPANRASLLALGAREAGLPAR
jgi:WD40 repeat protein/transcriptional regulator with XRE-family HTH domain